MALVAGHPESMVHPLPASQGSVGLSGVWTPACTPFLVQPGAKGGQRGVGAGGGEGVVGGGFRWGRGELSRRPKKNAH